MEQKSDVYYIVWAHFQNEHGTHLVSCSVRHGPQGLWLMEREYVNSIEVYKPGPIQILQEGLQVCTREEMLKLHDRLKATDGYSNIMVQKVCITQDVGWHMHVSDVEQLEIEALRRASHS